MRAAHLRAELRLEPTDAGALLLAWPLDVAAAAARATLTILG